MFCDYHIHSHFSSDCEESIEAIIAQALKLHMPAICFTDHMDFDFPVLESAPLLTFDLDIASYTQKLLSVREQIKDIDINIGMELGMQKHIAKKNSRIAASFPFDFIIASTHLVEGTDPYYESFWQGRDIDESLTIYFNDILNCISSYNDFDVYGHLDYIIRYIPDKSYSFSYKKYSDIIDTILTKLIHMGKGIEVNSGAYKYNLPYPNPCPDILKRYKELGGEILTIGSDAHKALYVGSYFDRVGTLLEQLDFKYYTIFKERKPIFIRI